MSIARLNDMRVTSFTLTLPRYGRGQADVYLPRLAGPKRGEWVTLEIEGRSFDMSVCLAGRMGPGYSVRAVQGVNALHTPLAPRFYENFTKERVLLDGIRDAGEVAGLVNVDGFLAKFSRLGAPLVHLLRDLEVRWWFDAAGRLCAGERSGEQVTVRSLGFTRDTVMTRLNPTLEPGMLCNFRERENMSGAVIERVVHRSHPKGRYTELYV